MTQLTVKRNPMGFHCPPNGTDPCYASEHDFRRFIAFGLLRCYADLEPQCFSEHEKVDDDTVRELRDAFLNVVEGTLQFFWLGEFEIGQSHFDADMFGDGCTVMIGEEDDEVQLMLGWSPFAIKEDDIIFDMYCHLLAGEGTGGDPTTLFLNMEAIQDKAACKAIIEEAHQLNAYPFRTPYQSEENERLWKRVFDGLSGVLPCEAEGGSE